MDACINALQCVPQLAVDLSGLRLIPLRVLRVNPCFSLAIPFGMSPNQKCAVLKE